MKLERSQRRIALFAAAALLLSAIAAVVCLPSDHPLKDPVSMLSASVLATAFLGRQRAGGPDDAPADTSGGGATAPGAGAAQPDPAESRRQDEAWLEALLEFAQDALGALQGDRLRLLIAQKLPALVGREDVWVVANTGGQQQVVLPQRADREPRRMISDEPRQWATFPLKSDGQTVGVMGLELGHRGITAREWRLLIALAGVLGRALKTSEAFEAMREATLVDPLTGCATRAEGLRRFEAELRRAERSKTALAVLMIDLDHFKSINDRYGHNTGDAVLSAVGETLLGTLRASDIRSRWGGEEFLVVLPESTIERASSAAESLRQRIAATAVRHGSHDVQVTTSIGITIARPGETDIPRLLGRADTALYQAKSDGRNRVMVALSDQKPVSPAPPAAPPSTSGSPSSPATPGPNDPPSGTVPAHAREQRSPTQVDRRSGMGRRRTDLVARPWAAGNS